jgi:multisubunit Na+/H+ antiporter MnhG subunit
MPELYIYNYYVISMVGIVFEIFGALFLSMEAIGIERFSKFYKYVYRISLWTKKSHLRTLILFLPFTILMILALILRSKILFGLMIPITNIPMLLSMLIDKPDWYEKWIINKTNGGKISPIGFLLIVFGNVLQLISIFWQMVSNN